MGDIFVLALTAALNPTLVAASTVMMLLPNPVRLMLGYLLGALLKSGTLGVLIISAARGVRRGRDDEEHRESGGDDRARVHRARWAPWWWATGRPLGRGGTPAARGREEKEKGPPRWQRALEKGFGAGDVRRRGHAHASRHPYLAGLSRIDKANYSTPETVLAVLSST